MEVKPNVVSLPSDWVVCSLSEICLFLDGLRRPVKDTIRATMKGDIPYYGASGIVDYVNDFIFDDELILLGEDGENILSRNTRLAFRISGKAWVNNHAHVLKPLPVVNIGYLCDYLESLNYEQYNSGTAQPKLNKQTCQELPIALPPTLAEQEAIAEALSDADACIESLGQLLAKKRQIKQGAMQELLTFTPSWSSTTIFDMAERQRARFNDGDWIESEHISNSGTRLIQTGNIGIGSYVEKHDKKYIHDDSFSRLKCKELFEGDLLICRLAEPAGRTCLLPYLGENRLVTSVDVTIFRPKEDLYDRRFLKYLLSTDEWFRKVQQKVGGTTHVRISRAALGNIEIGIPVFEEQKRIGMILSIIDDEINAIELKLQKARQVKQAMMQKLLTGRIRLVKPSVSSVSMEAAANG